MHLQHKASHHLRSLIFGDIVGQAGLDCLEKVLPKLRKKYNPDLVLVNGENVTNGFGIDKKDYDTLNQTFAIDVITTGNHWNDQMGASKLIKENKNLLAPANMENVPNIEYGCFISHSSSGASFAVINLLGRFAMKGHHSCPFKMASLLLEKIKLRTSIVFVDFHAEASSEKQALAHFLSSKVSVIYGTHTHCQTADERILKKHTAFITDIGMTGAYDSVIGINKDLSINSFLNKQNRKKNFKPAFNDPWSCALLADIEPKTGACKQILRISLRAKQIEELPA